MSTNKTADAKWAPRLSRQDLSAARQILEETRARIDAVAKDDSVLKFKLRRYVYIRLQYDERQSPANRKALKKKKRAEQNDLCALCKEPLPIRGAILDRLRAIDGYTIDNTRLICALCDRAVQAERKFT